MKRSGTVQRRVLVVAAHPDDEVLGCGGTIARHAERGDRVDILILAEGATSRDRKRNAAARAGEIARLRDCARAAAKTLGARAPQFGGLPDNRMDGLDLIDVVKIVESAVGRLGPDTVYVHHAGDLNVDHRIAHQAAITACRPLPGSSVKSIFAFETPSSTEWAGPSASFQPSRFVSIESCWHGKLKALKAYSSEMRPYPHARSFEAVEALARWRGASSGLVMAEAYEVLREIEN